MGTLVVKKKYSPVLCTTVFVVDVDDKLSVNSVVSTEAVVVSVDKICIYLNIAMYFTSK